MTARPDTSSEYSFAAEGMAGTAAAAVLRRMRALADQAPTGRMFAAIASLTEMSRRAESSLAAGHAALAGGNGDAANLDFAKAIVHMDRMAASADLETEAAEGLPDFLHRRSKLSK